jgi:hypothetical protein
MFVSLFRYPVATVGLTGRIYTALQKVFDAKNPSFRSEFSSERDAEDWKDYRVNTLDSLMTWKTKGFEKMKTAINSVLIVDLPTDQETVSPEPYSTFLDFEKVIDFKTDDEAFEWILFNHSKGKKALYDSESYYLFDDDDVEIFSSQHFIGHCPARFMWTSSISPNQPHVKQSPISSELGNLDLLLFFLVSNEHLNLYGRYPIYSSFASDCDYNEDESGHYCSNGFLKNQQGLNIIYGGIAKPCPVCEKSRLNGAGSSIEIDPPNEINGNADLRNPVQITTIDRDSLDYNNEDIERRETKVYQAVTGDFGHSMNNKAVNEKQVTGIFESMEAALKFVQWNFEQIMEWEIETICKLRYNGSFVSAAVNLGTEHYLLSAGEIMEMYANAKASNFSTSTLDILENKYFEAEYKNNPEQLNRQQIISSIDPFRHLSSEVIDAMHTNGSIRFEDYLLKVNLSTFISKFERENLPLNQFGTGINYEVKINNIQEVLRGYALAMQPIVEQSGGNDVAIRDSLETYGIGVRAGAITPQTEDEINFRNLLSVPTMSKNASKAWEDDGGIRRPTTLKSKTETDAIIDKTETN